MIGQVLDRRYEITAKLAEGAFGKTFQAKDKKRPGEPTCVVKQLKLVSSSEARRLFKTEAEILEKLGTHDQIPQLLADLEENGEFYLVQEYIAGHPLTDELKPGEPLEEAQVMSILLDLLEVLEAVHARNVIHRDIKPDNIIRRDGDKKLVLIDFGAVKKIVNQSNPQNTIMIGTHGYMPPEQMEGKPQLSSDVYAVGMVAIQAIAGTDPMQLPKDSQTNEVIWPDRAKVSPELAEVLKTMVRYDHQQRYSSAKEALAAVQALQSTTSANSTIVSQNSSSKLPVWAIAPIIAVGVLVPTVIYLWPKPPVPPVVKPPKLELNGEVVTGALGEDDSTDPINESYSDVYTFTGSKGDKVAISVASNDFDPKLEVLDSQKNSLGSNDDRGPQDSNSLVEVELPATGKYTVVVTSSMSGEVGDYSLLGEVISP
ncbi:MAG: protein kinase [Hormoscilla sp.]